jgi:eukaryotic-like serine/threonine-protein kinase
MRVARARARALAGGSAIGARALKPEHPATPQILLVDDNPTNLQVLYQTLEGEGYRLLAAKSGRDALAIAERTVPDLIMLDVMMPDMDGFDTCVRLKANPRTRESPVIFLSALTESRDKVRGLELGAVDFVNKPFQAEEVLARVRTHLTIRNLNKQLRRRNDELEHELAVAQELLREAKDRGDGVLLGESALARRLRQEIAEAARSDELLLIAGPPGSDHEAVARAVHNQSARAAHAIICVNCLSAVSRSLLAPEAAREPDIAEKVRLARGGVLYLEGIHYLSDISQRVVAGIASQSDVRVIMASSRSLDEELAAGRIVPELHRAIRTTIELAPLSERLDDLPVLARHIVQRQAEQADRVVPRIGESLLARLKDYRWPGNLRELRSVLELSLSTSHGDELEVADSLLDDRVRIGSYQLIDRLGSGGMGDVWLARHHLLARPAAVKLVRESAGAYAEDETRLRRRFEREAHATAELQSPHTVQLYDFGVTETGNFYYVMERLRGMDLQRMVERYGPLECERAVFLLKQACRSLSEAHHLGLVHRDVKPANLFVCRLGQEHDFLKVLDFGMVSRTVPTEATQASVAGSILGTPAFLAPELASSAGQCDARADIYALGCVAFWLLTGQPPFDASDVLTLIKHHADTPPSPPSALSEEPIPAELDAIVLACLSKERESRPATADVLWERLDALTFGSPWDQGRARAWWEQHAPELVEG